MTHHSDDHLKTLRARVAKAPQLPGIYRWLDAEGNVLYVGKAKQLRNRLKSYVAGGGDIGPWKRAMLRHVADFQLTVTNSELEALILESNLIKELQPKYNVMLKDDKNYVYVRISLQDQFPRVDVVRKVEEDGAKYFGPKTSARDVRQTLAFLRTLYPYRTCRMGIEGETPPSPDPLPRSGRGGDEQPAGGSATFRLAASVAIQVSTNDEEIHRASTTKLPSPDLPAEAQSAKVGDGGRVGEGGVPLNVICRNKDRQTPCLDFHIGQCSAPCIGRIMPEDYRRTCIDGVVAFFKGDTAPVAALVRERMGAAAAERKFETAAQLRDQLRMIDALNERQLVSDTSLEDADIVGVGLLSGRAHVVVFQERGGKIVGESAFALQGGADSACEVLDQFLPQYYADASGIPPVVVIGESCSDTAVMTQWLVDRRGAAVELRVPERGKKSRLLALAERNALEKAKHAEASWESDARNAADALAQLQDLLALPSPPSRIEAYDISHLGGTETVGSMVVAIEGKTRSDQYRTFAVRSVARGLVDDYASLREVLTRRLRHAAGGLKGEARQWMAQGIVITKAKKADNDIILGLIRSHPEELSDDDIDAKQFFVARQESTVVACARLWPLPDRGPILLRSVLVIPEWRGKRLGQFLVRTMLATMKKGKVYVTIDPALEQYYAEVGFRHVIKPPSAITAFLQSFNAKPDTLVMVYDALQHKPDVSLQSVPDLLVIDGGKGQLAVGIEVTKALGLSIPVISLAKREEDVYASTSPDPVALGKESAAQFLLQRLRDEAHRFANTLRERRGWKQTIRSSLDELPGIGPATKRELLKRFGSVESIRAASDDALREIVTEAQMKTLRGMGES